ncbi:MAG: hypothetical protein MUP98_19955 [Candidatus Aminicenantes bacterium]|nr:hypothetical protein [Candidatus Aminicenantes bacterium]
MSNKIRFFLVFILCFLVFNSCVSSSRKWISKKYDEGFSMKHPESWQARVVDREYILISSKDPEEAVPFILVHPFFQSKKTEGGTWFRNKMPLLQAFFENADIERLEKIRNQPDEWTAGFRCQKNDVECRGLALCSIHEKSGILYVIASEADKFDNQKDELIKVLESFRFEKPDHTKEKALKKPQIKFTDWQDPVEQAFSLKIPEGWTVEGGTFRRASVDLMHVLWAESSDKTKQVLFNDSRIPVFALPSPMLSMAGFYEGSWYSPGYGVNMLVKRYAPGGIFLKEYISQNLNPLWENFEFISQTDRPDVVSHFNNLYSQFMNYGISFTLDAGEAAFCFEQNSEPFVGYGIALTQITQTTNMQGGNWSVALMTIYTCPASEDETVRHIAETMFQSLQMNPQWVASQQQIAANVSQIVTRTNQEISNIINESYWTRQNTLDHIHRRFSNYILGVTDVIDPDTGETWTVEAGRNYYWRKDHTNTIAGTDVYKRPDIDFSVLKQY